MTEIVQNFLFDAIGIVGVIVIILTGIWWCLELLNKVFRFSKYIIMYHTYAKNKEMYNLKDKLVVSKDGYIAYSCVSGLDERIEILSKAIDKCNNMKRLQGKFSEKAE